MVEADVGGDGSVRFVRLEKTAQCDEHGRRDVMLSLFGAVEVGADEERVGDDVVPGLCSPT